MSPDELRFWAKVRIGDGCWEWTGGITHRDENGGYGTFWLGRGIGAHRAAWILTAGPIPAGMQVCHRCDNPRCVRPGHLFLGTHADNQRDKVAKGRNARGFAVWTTRLSVADVAELHRLHGEGYGYKKLAQRFGISPSNACRIARGLRRPHEYKMRTAIADAKPAEKLVEGGR